MENPSSLDIVENPVLVILGRWSKSVAFLKVWKMRGNTLTTQHTPSQEVKDELAERGVLDIFS